MLLQARNDKRGKEVLVLLTNCVDLARSPILMN